MHLKNLIRENIYTTIQMMNDHEEYKSLKEVLRLVLNNLNEPKKEPFNKWKLQVISQEEQQRLEEEQEKEYRNSPFRCLLVQLPVKTATDKLRYDRKYYARFKIYYQLYMDGLNQIKIILNQNFSGIGTQDVDQIVNLIAKADQTVDELRRNVSQSQINLDLLSKELGPFIIKILEQETPYSVMKKYSSNMDDIIHKYYGQQDFY